jgi:hypothetical protein
VRVAQASRLVNAAPSLLSPLLLPPHAATMSDNAANPATAPASLLVFFTFDLPVDELGCPNWIGTMRPDR